MTLCACDSRSFPAGWGRRWFCRGSGGGWTRPVTREPVTPRSSRCLGCLTCTHISAQDNGRTAGGQGEGEGTGSGGNTFRKEPRCSHPPSLPHHHHHRHHHLPLPFPLATRPSLPTFPCEATNTGSRRPCTSILVVLSLSPGTRDSYTCCSWFGRSVRRPLVSLTCSLPSLSLLP